MRIFQYRGTNGVEVLRNSSFKVSSPFELNDPFDCQPVPDTETPESVQALRDKILKKPEVMKMMAGLRHPDLPPNADLGEIQRSWRELAGQAASDHEAIATQMKQCYEEIAIICFTIEKSQHLMWAHYADKHRGMVIEIESDGVFEPPLEEVTAVNRLYPVSYSPERPIFSFDKLSPAAFITKGMAWEYEHERRVLYFSEKFETRYKDGKELRFRKVPPESFRSVYLGNRVSPEVRGEVLALVGKDPLKHIKVYQMDLDPKGFQLHERQLTNGADPLGKGFRA